MWTVDTKKRKFAYSDSSLGLVWLVAMLVLLLSGISYSWVTHIVQFTLWQRYFLASLETSIATVGIVAMLKDPTM